MSPDTDCQQVEQLPGGGVFADLDEDRGGGGGEEIERRERVRLLRDVSFKVRVELGRGKLLVKDLLRLTTGSVVPLDSAAGDPLGIYVNDRLIARGEAIVVDGSFRVRITEVLAPEDCMRVTAGEKRPETASGLELETSARP